MSVRWNLFAALVALVLFAALASATAGIDSWKEAGPGGADDLDALVIGIFDDHVIALEVLGVLLTAAMIGSLVIARPFANPPDTSYYLHVTDDQLEASMALADPGATITPPPFVAPPPGPLPGVPAKEEE